MKRLLPLLLVAVVALVLAVVFGDRGASENASGATADGAAQASADVAGADAGEHAPGRLVGDDADAEAVRRRAGEGAVAVRVVTPTGAAAQGGAVYAWVDGTALRVAAEDGFATVPAPRTRAVLRGWDGERFSPPLALDAEAARARGEVLLTTETTAGALMITVTDGDGAALPGARARVVAPRPEGRDETGVVAAALAAASKGTHAADAAGRITLHPLPPARYQVEVFAAERVVVRATASVEAGATARLAVALPRAASVHGVVVDGEETPVAKAEVALFALPETEMALFDPLDEFRQFGRMPDGIPVAHAGVTDADGRFRMPHVRPGRYRLLVASAGHRPEVSAEPIEVAAGDAHDCGRIPVHGGGRLRLMVRGPQGAPLEDAQVRWRKGGGAPFGLLPQGRSRAYTTDARGEVTLEALPFGEVDLRVVHADMRPLQAEAVLRQTRPDVALELDMLPGIAVSGTVVDEASGAPLAGVRIALEQAGDAEFDPWGLRVEREDRVVSGEDGGFRFPNVAPGEYVAVAESETHARTRSEEFTVGDAGAPPLLMRMGSGARLRVEVLDATDAPVPGAAVIAINAAVGVQRNAETDEHGIALFEHLARGTYQVARVPEDGSVPFQMPGEDLDIRMKFVSLEAGDDVLVTLGGREVHATVEGHVTRQGAPVPAYAIVLITTDGVKMSRADQNGYFALQEVPPGEHVLMATPPAALGGGGGGSHYDSVTVPPEGGIVVHDVVLPGGEVTVEVLAEGDDEPLQGIPVFLRDAEGTHLSGGDLGMTDESGETTFQSVAPGDYVVLVGRAAAPMLPGGEGRQARVREVSLATAGAHERVVVRLGEGATFRARVSDFQGNYVQGAHLYYLDENGQPLSVVSMQGTNSKGVAQLEGLPPGPGRILARHPTLGVAEVSVQLQAGELAKREITLGDGCLVHVTPVDERGRELGGVLVTAVDERGTPASYMWSLAETQEVRTAYFSGGAQKLGPLAPGDYVIQLIRPGRPIVRESLTVPAGTPEMHLRLEYAP